MDKLRIYVSTSTTIEQQGDTLSDRVKEAESNYAAGKVTTGSVADLFRTLDDESIID